MTAGEHRHILLVEDDASLGEVIGRNLARRGLEVRTETTVSNVDLRVVSFDGSEPAAGRDEDA